VTDVALQAGEQLVGSGPVAAGAHGALDYWRHRERDRKRSLAALATGAVTR